MNDNEQVLETQDGLMGDVKVAPPQPEVNENETEIPHLVPEEPDNLDVAPEEVLEKPEFLEDKFWDAKEGVKLEELNNSYKELQKQFSMGKHKAPAEYDLSVFDGIDVESDELAKQFVSWANENKPTQEAFDKLVGTFRELADVQEEASSINIEQETAKLGPNAQQIINGMKQWAQGLVAKGVWSESDLDEFRIAGATADGISMLSKLRRYYGEQAIPTATVDMDGMPSREELYDMVKDPQYKSDPNFRRKVEEQFSRAFPGVATSTGEI